MIDQKVITGILFGAACLQGIRSCAKKDLPKTAAAYGNEIYAHIQYLFNKENIPIDYDAVQAWSESLTAQDVNKIKQFFNKIFVVHMQNKHALESVGHYFNGRPLTYGRFFFIECAPQTKQILLACLACTKSAEKLLGSGNSTSVACADYMSRSSYDAKEQFELLFKPIIKMHLHYKGPKTSPDIAKQLNCRSIVKYQCA